MMMASWEEGVGWVEFWRRGGRGLHSDSIHRVSSSSSTSSSQSPGCHWDVDGLLGQWGKNGHFTDHSCAYSLSSLKSPS